MFLQGECIWWNPQPKKENSRRFKVKFYTFLKPSQARVLLNGAAGLGPKRSGFSFWPLNHFLCVANTSLGKSVKFKYHGKTWPHNHFKIYCPIATPLVGSLFSAVGNIEANISSLEASIIIIHWECIALISTLVELKIIHQFGQYWK